MIKNFQFYIFLGICLICLISVIFVVNFSPKNDSQMSSMKITDLAQKMANDMVKNMDFRFYEYGMKLPNYPFENEEQCVLGKEIMPEKENVISIINKINDLKINNHIGKVKWDNDWEWIEWKYIIKMSSKTVMFIKTYRSKYNKFFKANNVKICHIEDNNCLALLALDYIEE